MADVASPEGDNELVVATPEGCRAPLVPETGGANGEGDMAAADNRVVDDKVSIHEILEGMTNEFNKGVSPTKINDNDKMETEETVTPLPSKVVDEASKRERELDDVSEEAAENPEDIVIPQAPEENHNGEEESLVNKQEAVKKDNNKARIILTFRTIDENTDHGKKTKISSCSSNLTLVPDELACNDIGGVLVKIENSDENYDVVEESQAEDSRVEESQVKETQAEESQSEKSQTEETKKKESTKTTEPKIMNEDKVEKDKNLLSEENYNSDTLLIEKKPEITENNVENSNDKIMFAEDTVQQEITAPVTRKRRIGRPRLRALRFFVFSYYFCRMFR